MWCRGQGYVRSYLGDRLSKLDDDEADIAATNMARDMSLNQSSPLVQSLYSFALS